ncbi:MAG: DNA topoisomerase I [Nanoarchaeota archaeon]|nr:DNA topoisomerase I [Nanoarchaeota archaeon]
MTELIICEKPSAANKVAHALADDKPVKKANKKVPYYELHHGKHRIIVGCAVGHLYGIAQKGEKGWTYPVFDVEWKPTFEMSKDADYSKAYVDTLKILSKKAKDFTVACDYDIEGEVIGWNALRFACGVKDGNRMKFSTLTKTDLIEAYENKNKHLDWGQAKAGETRHKLDWFYGINLSRALSNSIKAAGSFKVMSIGRVQGPALKFLVDREREIAKFKSEPYWQLMMLTKNKIEAWHEKDKFWDKKEADKIYTKIKGEKKTEVAEVKRTQHTKPAPPPFDLTTLQTESHRHFGMTPKEALSHAQSLYLAGLISYPRTSSQQLTPKIGFEKILKGLSKQGAYDKLCGELLAMKKLEPHNGKKTDPAHPAIYPTGHVPSSLKEREKKVYDLIVHRFMATFGPDALRETLDVKLDVKKEIFKAQGRRTLEEGWQKFYGKYMKLKELELPSLKKGDVLDIKKIDKLEKETQPPKRFTQSSILKELEKRNIGTKATRAEIIDTLFKRGYVEGKAIEVTKFGMETVVILEKYCHEILDEKLTREFENEMEEIRSGKERVNHVLDTAKKVLTKILDKFKKHEKDIGKELLEAVREAEQEARTIGECPVCGKGTLKIIRSKKTKKQFVACDRYPKCETTYPLPQRALIQNSEKVCKDCNYPMIMVIRKGKRPQELCINPKCKSKKLEAEEKKVVEKFEKGKVHKKCPECGGELILRSSFYGKFWGCSGYPKCRHTESLTKKKKFGKKKGKKK